MVNVAIIGLGKMGVSHLAIANALPRFQVVGICDSTALVGSALSKVTSLPHFTKIEEVFALPDLQAIIVATPTSSHESILWQAIDRNVHVFCEKPLTLSPVASQQISAAAAEKGLVAQVGYHNRFVAAFGELRRLIELGAVGRVSHVLAEAYGPVVTRPAKMNWRGKAVEGGGALFDYAAHPLNLLNWCFGPAESCGAAVLSSIYSRDVDDQVSAILNFNQGVTAQLSVNWSDSSQRKMTTQISVWGEHGKLYADRQEVRAFLADSSKPPDGYETGWNVRYTTELTPPVQFYLRGEEYSAQLEHFAERVSGCKVTPVNTFEDAAETDLTIEMIRQSRELRPSEREAPAPSHQAGFLNRLFGR